jgi:exopolysaccharide biosynthesis polyprenyl glycosylphosphotransferase
MNQQARNFLLEGAMLADLVLCALVLTVSWVHDFGSRWLGGTLLVERPVVQLALGLMLVSGWHLSFVAVGAYRSHRLSTPSQLAIMLGKATLISTLCAALWSLAHALPFGAAGFSFQLFALQIVDFAVLTFTLLLISRMGARYGTRWMRRRGRNLRFVLMVGTNSRAVAMAEFMTQHSSLGYRLTGFVDKEWHAAEVPADFRPMLMGDLEALPSLLRVLTLDEVVIALPIASFYEPICSIIAECRKHGIIARCEGRLFDGQGAGSFFASEPSLITLHESYRSRKSVLIKRLLDLVVSLCALLVLSPLFVAIAVAIKVTSPGPVLFRQERVGLGKRRFRIYKFRTMVEDAEKRMHEVAHLNESAGPTFKLARDPRITPIGRLLRRRSLDELPQLINVLLGEMSLVGPRPLPVRDYNGFSEDWYRRRFSVKPGITCLWQIMGRSSIAFDRWMELDINYIDSWSLWLDLKILLRTIPVVLRGSGAV